MGESQHGDEEVGCGDQGDVAVPAGPGAAFEVVESEAFFQFSVVVFDAPPDLAQSYEVGWVGVGGKAGQPVFDRLGLLVWPLGDKPPDGQGAVSVTGDAAPGRADAQETNWERIGPMDPSRQVTGMAASCPAAWM